MSTKQEVINFLDAKLKKNPATSNNQWYVGIASDVRARLFGDHNVDEKNDPWAHSTADTSAIAREVEKLYLDAGCDGGGGGGDASTKTVYIYLKSSGTDP